RKSSSRVDTSIITYTFYCAQLKGEEAKHVKVDDTKKQRAQMKVDRFVCDGWLHITINENDLNVAAVRMTHHRCHNPCVDISIPKSVKETVEKMRNLPASKVSSKSLPSIWEAVLKADPKTELNEKQIYRYWAELNADAWRLHDDQLKSALAVLEK
ncbi:hypothetical protein B0H17DRAFT_931407, partial [Mycena rosella]